MDKINLKLIKKQDYILTIKIIFALFLHTYYVQIVEKCRLHQHIIEHTFPGLQGENVCLSQPVS